MRSTFKVLFYVNGSKEKNGIVPIMGRVTINGSVAQFSCKLTIAKTMFASFTALSFVDIKELTTDDIVEINGEKWILSKRHKTKVNFQVKLLDIPLHSPWICYACSK